MSKVITKKLPGRKRTENSVRMSRSMFRLHNVEGLTYQAIANQYNAEKRRATAGKTLTAQAVYKRIRDFRFEFPDEAKAILGSLPTPQNVESTPAVPVAA